MANESERTTLDPRPEEPMVAVFRSSNYDGELEAMSIKGVLEANNIPAILVGPHILPNLEFQVQVPQHLLGEAERLIRDARQGGRQAADEGEAEMERETKLE
jgi:hypothetical protein